MSSERVPTVQQKLKAHGITVDKIHRVISEGDSSDGEMILFETEGTLFEAHLYRDGEWHVREGWTE